MFRVRHSSVVGIPAFLLIGLIAPCSAVAAEPAAIRFNEVRNDPVLLRQFLYRFPKGGDLHNHIDGAIYAENFIAWAAEDGKCVDLSNNFIVAPPCDTDAGRPPVSQIQFNAGIVNPLIDAMSVRNYERRPVSGHNQFFSTFRRFSEAGLGREGDMLAETSVRAARQNMLYLELMQSWGMSEARQLAPPGNDIDLSLPLADYVDNDKVAQLVRKIIAATDRAEARWREKLACDTADADAGCDVTIRYLAQVIRVFPRPQVFAQTLLAFRLIESDPRYVGLNFVAPEDNPVSLRDHSWQMRLIGNLTRQVPGGRGRVTLHAGELAPGLVPPEHLGRHIREAMEIAGARRIGHGVDIVHDPDAEQLLRAMAEQGVMVEINLTSNDVILGVHGKRHPFDLYRRYGVPLALSTDDEGVSRIDLTHEYQRAVESYDVSYADLKNFSRNSLHFSFIAGDSLFRDLSDYRMVAVCRLNSRGRMAEPESCEAFLSNSEKASLQWQLEQRFAAFEDLFE